MKQKCLNNLANFFQFKANATSFRTESLAGFTTFLMAYVIFVNPAILVSAGINPGAAFVATCLASAIGCFLIGLMANYPIAIAPGMGLNAYFTYVVVQSLHFSWQDALGMVFIAGVIFFLLAMTQARIALIKAIPPSLVLGIGAGIGFFLALIALKNANILVPNAVTFLQLGNLHSLTVLLFLLALYVMCWLNYFVANIKNSIYY